MGVDEVGVNEMGCRRSGATSFFLGFQVSSGCTERSLLPDWL